MLIRLAMKLTELSPRFKRFLWRRWYQYLAGYQLRDWRFMNYGYSPLNAAAPLLDLQPADEPNRSSIHLYHHVASAVPLSGLEVLEVGCGRGGGAAYVARALGPRRMVAVDLSPRAIDLCRARFSAPNLAFQVGDAERLPFADGSFDVVLNVESSHCYGRFDLFLREVRRVLRPDGHFLYADFRPGAEVPAWRGALVAAGFTIAAERDLRPGVVAALDADDDYKRDLIGRIVDRPLAGIFREFAGLRGTTLNDALRNGDFSYRAFVLTP